MKKLVLAGSVKIQNEFKSIMVKLKNEFEIIDYPRPINKKNFIENYPRIHAEFYKNITKTDVLLIVNADRNGITGNIGAESFAELAFGLAQKLVYGKNIELYILKLPEKSVKCYDEIMLWLELGWIKVWDYNI